jgi:hypothetical protein
MSCIVSKKMICPDDRDRMSLARNAICVVRLDLCLEMILPGVSIRKYQGRYKKRHTVCA